MHWKHCVVPHGGPRPQEPTHWGGLTRSSCARARAMTQSQRGPPPARPPLANLTQMFAEPALKPLQYMLDLRVFDELPLREEPLAVLCARVGEDRSGFLAALARAGVDSVGDRQKFANALLHAVREGRITRGWAKPPPATCAHCGALPVGQKKLLTCGRCKQARYCNATCQRAHWAAGHKAACCAPATDKVAEWRSVGEGNEAESAAPNAWKKQVGVGGWGGHPILGDGVVRDHRE